MINTYSDQREIIESYFKQVWDDTCPILWNNTRKSPPKSGRWIRFNILNGEGNQVSIGSTPLHRNAGLVSVQIFVKKGVGASQSYQLVDLIVAAFKRKQLDSVQFRTPSVLEVGEIDEWFQVNVTCPFYRNSF